MARQDLIHYGKFLLTYLNVAINQEEIDWRETLDSYDRFQQNQLIKTKSGSTDIHRPGLMYINWVVANYFKFDSLLVIENKTRKREWMRVRQTAQYLSVRLFQYTLEKVGVFYDIDHATVYSNVNRVQNLIDTEPEYKVDVINLINKLTKKKDGEEITSDSPIGEPESVQQQSS
jgi:hypothetical protein